jgi:hypothetical protein
MAVLSALIITTMTKNVLGLRIKRKVVRLAKKRVNCSCLTAIVRLSLPIAKSTTKNLVRP